MGMLNSYTWIDSEMIQRSMLDGLNRHIRAAIEKRFAEVAKEVVDEAVVAACKEFEVGLKTYKEMYKLQDTVEVILKDARGK